MELLKVIQQSLDEPGFCRTLGIRAVSWDPNKRSLVLRMDKKADLEGGAGPGHMHGGAVGAFVDTAATFALLACGVENCPTANYRLDLLRPVFESGVTARATVRRRGRLLAVVDVDVIDDADRLVAIGRATFAILD
ncbi:MAG: PaaI family thioesterase [Acidimicrobiaceae bacterium]|nr:PaaI family thioesterase [Chromatiales bacterium]MYC52190.1 PaaI family thioesterase [Gammaproteobacteria bacterium]MYI37166.1 PaaI family thioesterase [Acidimicrobiaceae bacterium]